jgi:hypothetical protein
MQGLIRRMADDNYHRKQKYTVNYSLDSMINDEFARVRTKIQHLPARCCRFGPWSIIAMKSYMRVTMDGSHKPLSTEDVSYF